MEIENLLDAKTRQELRDWLESNSTAEKCCWVLVSILEKPGVVQYLDAVEEALCFGWIDGIMKKTEAGDLVQRLSPRKKTSNWTELNKERVRRLQALGLMKEGGLKILPDMQIESFAIDKEIETRLKEDKLVYENYLNFPELYRRIRIDTIQSYRNDPIIFNKRLSKFIDHTRENKMYGQWNDNGRLLNYK
ncbi:thymidylate synthase [Planococcus sp. CPCC 101016]|uniref:YdeI/OmpD-associated family protein n=1 Tax=Planococcus sp. CPCC 101016 TaxID=2599617 RepID=UPI0011B6B2EF|nr:YdeI/OmpD-associated family protein [Planococcus sp. CPCC 101016]TWT07918.1 thymidylate synthase [Planococcus sp. CPCC 101016]